ncbi:MAG: hypothetical protein JKX85_03735 [Phycisphaeraceae bacterium]|nr:hypothetical protein [Phycisphaeraceae bacterium]
MSQTDSKCCGSKSCCTEPSLLAKNHFLLRRLHSLSGIIPVGVFCTVHLFTNFQILLQQFFGETDIFQHEVDFIHAMPALIFIEIGLWSTIAFHAILGIAYTLKGKSNVQEYKHLNNWRYTMQRVTGVIALIFIFLHVATLRWRWDFFGWFTPFYAHGPDGEPLVTASTAYALQASWLVSSLYLIGALGVVYHWANGLWTAAITWGITISPMAQKRWGQCCLALGLALSVFTVGAIVGANTYEITPSELQAIEAMKAKLKHVDQATPANVQIKVDEHTGYTH